VLAGSNEDCKRNDGDAAKQEQNGSSPFHETNLPKQG
jgi:hypothetical protein